MIIIGEKINGSIPSVAKAIKERDEDHIKNLAIAQTQAGVDYIDVCASVEDEIEVETMKWLIDLVQEVSATPIAVDSPNEQTCLEAMKFCKKAGLFNSVSMEGNKVNTVFPVIADTEWEIVALLCDNEGIPQTVEKRLEVLNALMTKANEHKIDSSRFHIDPLVEMLCTSENGTETIEVAIKEIKKLYPTIHVTGAVSNISFNLPERKLINQAFTVLAMKAGLDSIILDPTDKNLMGMIYATEACLGLDEMCMEYLGGYRRGVFGNK